MKLLSLLATALTLGALGAADLPACPGMAEAGGDAPTCGGNVAADAASPAVEAPESGLTRQSFPVEGMTCGACAKSITKRVMEIDGVKQAEVNHKKGEAVVTYDARKVKPEAIVEAINKLGYKARPPVASAPEKDRL